jgi:hypothetical protein
MIMPEDCVGRNIEDIKGFVSYGEKPSSGRIFNIDSSVFYTEKSKGEFSNLIQDQKLFGLFEDIRKIVHSESESTPDI